MGKIILPALTLLAAALLLLAVPTDAEGAIYEDTVRLHILANSDSEEDQALKLAVRDAVLLEFGDALEKANSAEEASEKIEALLPEIEALGAKIVAEHGYSYPVRASIGKERYGTREYEGFTLPAGEYTSLKIAIGDAEGQNWWCVMYPPLCLGASVEDAAVGYSEEEVRLIKNGKVRVKFKALEVLSDFFG